MATSWTETYREHFQEHFQKPFDVQIYHDSDGAALKLATHDWALPGFRVFASLGMADRLARSGEQAVGEAILYCDVPDPQAPRLFVTALFFILQNNIPLTTRFSLGFGELGEAFRRRSGKSACYFTRAFSPDGKFNQVAELARVYQALFITPEEDEFLESDGSAAFEQALWSQLGEDFQRDEPLRPPVDLQEMDAYKARVADLWKRAAGLFRVDRPACV